MRPETGKIMDAVALGERRVRAGGQNTSTDRVSDVSPARRRVQTTPP